MSQRWEAVAERYDAEKPKMQEQIRSAPSIAEQAKQAKASAESAAPNGRAGAPRA